MRRAFTLVEMAVVIGMLGLLAAILWPVVTRGKNSGNMRGCSLNLKRLGLSIQQYNQDYDQTFPPASNPNGEGWANLIRPYAKSWEIVRCPSAVSSKTGTVDYFYNRRVAHLETWKFENLANTILIGDGSPDSPPNVSLADLPQKWRTDLKSPAFRHLEGARYVFADGHVNWMKPEKVTLDNPGKSNSYTFLPQ